MITVQNKLERLPSTRFWGSLTFEIKVRCSTRVGSWLSNICEQG